MRCAQCNEPLDLLAPGVRCRSKVRQQFACGKCASVDSRLRRLLGTWPLDEMKDCAEQDTFDFYRRAAAAVGPPSNSGLLCRCHACGIAVCCAQIPLRCASGIAACSAAVIRARQLPLKLIESRWRQWCMRQNKSFQRQLKQSSLPVNVGAHPRRLMWLTACVAATFC